MKLAELSRQSQDFEKVRGVRPTIVHIGDGDAKLLSEEIYEIILPKKRPPSADHIYRSLLSGQAMVAGIKVIVDQHRAADNFYFRTQ